jgi:YlmC/YmxH family sporulation protein
MGKRLSDIINLEIINVYNGDKYGYIGDCEINFDRKSGEIVSIGVSEGKTSFFSFKDTDSIEIPWTSKMKVCEKTLIFDHKI